MENAGMVICFICAVIITYVFAKYHSPIILTEFLNRSG